jgi:radical SAM-linked protein
LAEPAVEPAAPPAPEREAVRLRLRYQKTGDLRFVGHLDLVNLFRRAARRAKLPLHYSVGFHPQPSLSFGPPLSVGYEGRGEWLDLGLDSWRDPREVVEELNRMLPAGVRVEAGREVPLSTPSLTDRISAGEYLIRWSGAGAHAAELEKRVADFTAASDVPGSQWSKKGPVKVNLRAAVVWIKMDSAENEPGIRLLHETGATATAKVSTLVEYFGAPWVQSWQASVVRVASGRRQGEAVTIP